MFYCSVVVMETNGGGQIMTTNDLFSSPNHHAGPTVLRVKGTTLVTSYVIPESITTQTCT
jgi:hypothetical protein